MHKTITSHNETLLTGKVTDIYFEEILGYMVANITLLTMTTFQKISGLTVTGKTKHGIVMWQRHLPKDIEQIHIGNIISVKGEYKYQAKQTDQPGKWRSNLIVFATDFEILADDGILLPEPTTAKVYE